MKTRNIVTIIIGIIVGFLISTTIVEAKKLQPWESTTWNPNKMSWEFVSQGSSGTRFMYSPDTEFKKFKNGNIAVWVGLENDEAFKAIYVCIDPGRKKYHNLKEFIYDKQTRVTSYVYDIMRLTPNRYFITDDGGEWDVIEDGTLLWMLWFRLRLL